MASPRRRPSDRPLYAYGFMLLALGLVLSPLGRDPLDDGFPLSTFPMFSRAPEPTFWVTQALALRPDGSLEPLSPSLSAGTVEVLQAMVALRREVELGRVRPLCEAIAARVAADADSADVRAVAIANSEFDLDRYFTDHPEPLRRHTLTWCGIPR